MTGVLTRAEVEAAVEAGTLADWKRRRYEAFAAAMAPDEGEGGANAPFPCYFAIDAHEEGHLRYLFPGPAATAAGRSTLAAGLAAYLDRAPDIADYTSLAVLFEPSDEDRSAEAYRALFWDVLSYLRRHDPEPWPDSVPADPADPRWEFCFAGEPMFVVARTPCYEARRSRYAPYGLEITVQPRWVFDGLGADTEAGREARRTIRERLADYDDVGPHPDMGAYGDPDAHEWAQYALPDSNEERVDEFPADDWTA